MKQKNDVDGVEVMTAMLLLLMLKFTNGIGGTRMKESSLLLISRCAARDMHWKATWSIVLVIGSAG